MGRPKNPVICIGASKCNVPFGTEPEHCEHKKPHQPVITESKHRNPIPGKDAIPAKFCNDKGGLCCYIDEDVICE
jgi:hypothetical protein